MSPPCRLLEQPLAVARPIASFVAQEYLGGHLLDVAFDVFAQDMSPFAKERMRLAFPDVAKQQARDRANEIRTSLLPAIVRILRMATADCSQGGAADADEIDAEVRTEFPSCAPHHCFCAKEGSCFHLSMRRVGAARSVLAELPIAFNKIN